MNATSASVVKTTASHPADLEPEDVDYCLPSSSQGFEITKGSLDHGKFSAGPCHHQDLRAEDQTTDGCLHQGA